MRKVQKPIEDAKQVFRTCISIVDDLVLKARLEAIETDIETTETAFELAASTANLHTLPRQIKIANDVTIAEMTAVYNFRLVKKGTPGRAIYDKLLSLPSHGICPLCGQRTVASLDHHLPKAHYPALAVMPVNLIAACAECNKGKTNSYPFTAKEQTLHPYYDDIEDEPWLSAIVFEGSPAAVRFLVDPPNNWDEIMVARVRLHFKVFKLASLYASHSACEIVNIRKRLCELFEGGGADAVKVHLQSEADSRASAHINSWQTAMYMALAANKWFCEGGFICDVI